MPLLPLRGYVEKSMLPTSYLIFICSNAPQLADVGTAKSHRLAIMRDGEPTLKTNIFSASYLVHTARVICSWLDTLGSYVYFAHCIISIVYP